MGKLTIEPFTKDIHHDYQTDMYPSSLLTCEGEKSYSDKTSTHFGFVLSGVAQLHRNGLSPIPLSQGMYFCAPGQFALSGKHKTVLFQRLGYLGLFSVGGPVEQSGRLCYIDNCRSTLLVGPPRMGDPCLNLLSFPPNTRQSPHIHPTVRLGLVFAGEGSCVLPEGRVPLGPEMVFSLPAGQPHSFDSSAKGSMLVIAYHPDTDVGPTDSSHPMLSRTYITR